MQCKMSAFFSKNLIFVLKKCIDAFYYEGLPDHKRFLVNEKKD